MFRWHRRTCRKPDISVTDDVVFCSSCDTVAELPDLELYCSSTSFEQADDSTPSINLHWPSSVSYSTDEKTEDNSYEGSPGDINTNIHDSKRQRLESPKSLEDASTVASQLDGSLYPPFSQKYDTRLLRLCPMPFGNCLHGELDLIDLVFCPSFEALSYTWADENDDSAKSQSIFIGPFWDIIPITVNCDSALRLLLAKGHLDIWVDSICINQQDPRERSHQVSIMRDIYSKATQVLVYLGHADTYSDSAMEMLSKLSQQNSDDPVLIICDETSTGLTHLFERRYFFRKWVLQEIAMAKRVTLYCGNKSMSWASFNTLRIPSGYIRRVPWLLQYSQEGAAPLTNPTELLHLLNAASGCAASDPRDHIYAVLGLLRDGNFEGLVPDYTLSTEQVYTGIASYLLVRHGWTQILAYPKWRSGRRTWVPDWSVYRASEKPSEKDDDSNLNRDIFRAGNAIESQNLPPSIYWELSYADKDSYWKPRYVYNALSKEVEDSGILWLTSEQTAWTLFTAKQRPYIRHLTPLTSPGISDSLEQQSSVNSITGTLSIQACVLTSLRSYCTVGPCDFGRTVHYPGIQHDIEWLVKTEVPANVELDVIVYVSGCRSYLHMRRGPIGNHYSLLGNCRIGLRLGPPTTLKLEASKSPKRSIVDPRNRRARRDKNSSGRTLNTNHLCISYGADKSFLEFQIELVRSRLGKFLVAVFEARGEDMGNLQFDTLAEYLDLRVTEGAIWKLSSGWETTMKGMISNATTKVISNMAANFLEFWSRPEAWQILNAVEACMDSIDDLEIMLSDWYKVARALGAVGTESRHYMTFSGDSHEPCSYKYMIEPITAQRLGLPAYGASFQALMSALVDLTRGLMQQLESESDLFGDSVSGVVEEKGEEPGLNPTERARLERLYTEFMGSEAYTLEADVISLLVNFESEEFERTTKSRISILKWLDPSWQSWKGQLTDFREACQLMSVIDGFQEDIGASQTIKIV
ncbi:HET-domain-containing protein [Hypoxylon rubiginosum]|uniref:HET-domain-containing protein n=1 Tax=Hypoxylon rubiginosum TaxID=110542 RepID=A0ACB9YTN1_9PEZI|nr:HET-domain-containing protein [Hypoxylon rubiginosum]